jgi:hypothetical protein
MWPTGFTYYQTIVVNADIPHLNTPKKRWIKSCVKAIRKEPKNPFEHIDVNSVGIIT